MPAPNNQRSLYRRYSSPMVNGNNVNAQTNGICPDDWPTRGVQRNYNEMMATPISPTFTDQNVSAGNSPEMFQGDMTFKPNRKRYKTIDSAWVHSMDATMPFGNINDEWGLQLGNSGSPHTNDAQSIDATLQPSWASQLQMYENFLEKSKSLNGFATPNDNTSSFDSFNDVFPELSTMGDVFSMPTAMNPFRPNLPQQSHQPTPEIEGGFIEKSDESSSADFESFMNMPPKDTSFFKNEPKRLSNKGYRQAYNETDPSMMDVIRYNQQEREIQETSCITPLQIFPPKFINEIETATLSSLELGNNFQRVIVKKYLDMLLMKIQDSYKAPTLASSLVPGELSVVINTSRVAQKSYGSEKRFFCPPPTLKLYGSDWFTDSNTSSKMAHADSISANSCASAVVTVGVGESRNVIQGINVERVIGKGRNTFIGKAVFKHLFITDEAGSLSHGDDKRKKTEIWVKVHNPSGQEVGTFNSRPVKVISKPSKKRQSAKNLDLCIHSGTRISLFNRVRSQTVSTKYLGVSVIHGVSEESTSSGHSGNDDHSSTEATKKCIAPLLLKSPNPTMHNPAMGFGNMPSQEQAMFVARTSHWDSFIIRAVDSPVQIQSRRRAATTGSLSMQNPMLSNGYIDPSMQSYYNSFLGMNNMGMNPSMPQASSPYSQDFNLLNNMNSTPNMHDMGNYMMNGMNGMNSFYPTRTSYHPYQRNRNSISHPVPPQLNLPSFSQDDLENSCIYYNQEVVLQCTKTGLISGPLIVRRVEKGSLAVVGCTSEDITISQGCEFFPFAGNHGLEELGDPVSQLHKVAFQVKGSGTPGLYLSLAGEIVGIQKAVGNMKHVSSATTASCIRKNQKSPADSRVLLCEDVTDSAVWTIVGTDTSEHTFYIPPNREEAGVSLNSRLQPVTPIPTFCDLVLSPPPSSGSSSGNVEINRFSLEECQVLIYGENLTDKYQVWFGEYLSPRVDIEKWNPKQNATSTIPNGNLHLLQEGQLQVMKCEIPKSLQSRNGELSLLCRNFLSYISSNSSSGNIPAPSFSSTPLHPHIPHMPTHSHRLFTGPQANEFPILLVRYDGVIYRTGKLLRTM